MHLFFLWSESSCSWHRDTRTLNNVTGTLEWCKGPNAVSSRNIMYVLQTKKWSVKQAELNLKILRNFIKSLPEIILGGKRRTCPCKRGRLVTLYTTAGPCITVSYLSSCNHVFRFWSHCSNEWKIVAICPPPNLLWFNVIGIMLLTIIKIIIMNNN